MPGFDAVAILKYPHLERINHVHHAGNSSGIVDGAAARPGRRPRLRRAPRAEAARADQGDREDRHRPDDHADRPGAGDREDPGAKPAWASATSTSSRSTRPSPRWCCASCRPSTSTPARSTSTAAPSPWAIRSAPPARSSSAPLLDELERSDKEIGLATLCVGSRHGRGDDHREGLMGVIDLPTARQDRLDLPRALRLEDGRAVVAAARPGRRAHPVRRQPRHPAPGARSSLRHWHRAEDEFVMVTEGELVLMQDEGEYLMRPATAPPGRPATATATASSTAPRARRDSSSWAPRRRRGRHLLRRRLRARDEERRRRLHLP